MNLISLIRPNSLQREVQVALPQQELASLQHAPPPGAAVPLRRRSRLGERHGDVHAVGRRLRAHRLARLPQDPEGLGGVGRRDVGDLQGRTLVPGWEGWWGGGGREATM